MESTTPLDHLTAAFLWTRYRLLGVSTSEGYSLTISVHDPSSFDVCMLGEILQIELPLCLHAEVRLPFGPVGALRVERDVPDALLAHVPDGDLTAAERNELRLLRVVDPDGRTLLTAVADGYTWRVTDARAY